MAKIFKDGIEIANTTPISNNINDTSTEHVPSMAVIDELSKNVEDAIEKAVAPLATKEELQAVEDHVEDIDADVQNIYNSFATKLELNEVSANQAEIEDLIASKADIDDLTAAVGRIDTLESNSITTATFEAEQGRVNNLIAGKLDSGSLTAIEGDIENLKARDIATDEILAQKASVQDLTAANGRINTLETTTASINQALIDKASVSSLSAVQATIDSLDSTYVTTDFSNANVSWIKQGTIASGAIGTAQIADGAITSAKIGSLDAGKITTGKLNAANVEITNLNADNITVGTINGQRIGNASIDLNKLSTEVPTKEAFDNAIDRLSDQISGAIESWSGPYDPSFGNEPANAWLDDETRHDHIGDIFYNTETGKSYRFVDNGNGEYAWTLIRDNDLQQALADIASQGGQIDRIDQDYWSFKTDVNGELDEVKGKMTTVEGKIATAETNASDAVTTANAAMAKSGIKSTEVVYQTGTSATSAPTGTWYSTPQPVQPGEFLWTRTTVVYNDDTQTVSYSVGSQGADGAPGPAGAQGPAGPQGEKGENGAQGPKGDPGEKGEDGAPGPKGDPGEKGEKGDPGEKGADGEKGEKGDKGDKGDRGYDVSDARIQYYLSTSNSELQGGSWSDTPPEFVEGCFYWERLATTLSDGTTKYSNPVVSKELNEAYLQIKNTSTTLSQTIDTVNEHGRSITTLGQTVATKVSGDEFNTYKTTTTNAINNVKQTADANSADITSLTQTVTDNETDIENKYSSLVQTVNGLTSRVGTTESSITTINGNMEQIRIGGRNLLLNTAESINATDIGFDWNLSTAIADVTENDPIVLSGYIKTTSDHWFDAYWVSGDTAYPGSLNVFQHIDTPNTWVRFELGAIAGIRAATATKLHIRLNNAQQGQATSHTVELRNLKLERGTRATDWTPAPEDTVASINAINTTVNQQQTEINQTKEAIELRATKQEVTNVSNKLNNDYYNKSAIDSKFSVSEEGILASVGSNYATKSSVDVLTPELIVGTHGTTATATWTGTSQFLTEIKAGTRIQYKLSSPGAANVTLNLRLKDDANNNPVTTGPKSVYYNGTTRLGTQYDKGAIVDLVYDGTSWYVSNPYTNTTYDLGEVRWSNAVSALEDIAAGVIICGTSNGYKRVAANISFNLAYPILWTPSIIHDGRTSTDTYISHPSTNFSTTATVQGGSANLTVYLKGALVGNVFTIAATNFLTTVQPTEADGMYYIPLGLLSDSTTGYFQSSDRLYAFINGQFQPVDLAAKGAADKAANDLANYKTTVENTYLTQASWNTTKEGIDGKFSSIESNVTNITTNLSNLQDENVSGSLASRLKTAEAGIQANKEGIDLRYTKSEVDGLKSNLQNDIAAVQNNLNNLEIGGRNYILNSGGTLANHLESGNEYIAINVGQSYMNIEDGTTVTISFDLAMKVHTNNPSLLVYNSNNKGPKQVSNKKVDFPDSFKTADDEIHYTRAFVVTTIYDRNIEEVTTQDNFIEFYSEYGTGNVFSISNLKLEKGTKATDWTPAPEDIDAANSVLAERVTQTEAALTVGDGMISSVASYVENAKQEAISSANNNTTTQLANYTTTTDMNSVIDAKTGTMKDTIESNIASTYQTKTEAANAATALQQTLQGMQDQIDGAIETWSYAGVPTNSNAPAVDWDNDTLKDAHVGDLYFDTDTNKTYRYKKEGNTYSWGEITDSEISAVSALASSKKRIFTATPTPPYDIGDLWIQGANGDIKYAKVAKTKDQAYAAADWDLASKYTDDSELNNFKTNTFETYKTEVTKALDNVNIDVSKKIRQEVAGPQLNLLTDDSKIYNYSSSYGKIDKTKYNSDRSLTLTKTVTSDKPFGFYCTLYSEYTGNTNYTVKFNMRQHADSANNITRIHFYSTNPNNTATSVVYIDGVNVGQVNENIEFDFSDKIYHEIEVKFKSIASPTTGTEKGLGCTIMRSLAGAWKAEITNLMWTKDADVDEYSAHSTFKVMSDNISSKVSANGVISSINQSPEEITIDADRVNINGAAIFTNGRLSESSLNSAYDSKGSAATAESNAKTAAQGYATTAQSNAISAAATDATSKANAAEAAAKQDTAIKLQSYSTTEQMNTAIGTAVDNIEIGGKNLLFKTNNEYTATANSYYYAEFTYQNNLLIKNQYHLQPDVTYTFSADVESTIEPFSLTIGVGTGGYSKDIADSTSKLYNGRVSITFTPTESQLASYDIFAFRTPRYGSKKDFTYKVGHIKLEKGTKATDWTPAPEDVEEEITAANAEEQTIYIPAASLTSSITTPTTWVTKSNANGKTSEWSINRPPYDSSLPILFVATQRKTVGGTITCTTPVKDDTTTIIDGGHIITGTIDANKLNANDVKANIVQTTKILASQIDANVITTSMLPDDVKNSNIEIGGRNLLHNTEWNEQTIQRFINGVPAVGQALGQWYKETATTISINNNYMIMAAPSGQTARYGIVQDVYLTTGTYVFSIDNGEANGTGFACGRETFPTSITSRIIQNTGFYSYLINISEDNYYRFYLFDSGGSTELFTGQHVKLEKGNKATDWSPAPEDVNQNITNAINNIHIGGRNLLKFTSKPTLSNTYTKNSSALDWTSWTRYTTAVTLEKTAEGVKVTHNTTSTSDGLVIPFVYDNAVIGKEEVTISFEYRSNMTSIGIPYLLRKTKANVPLGTPLTITASETDWVPFTATIIFPTTAGDDVNALLLTYVTTSGGWIEFKDKTVKLEKGNKATEWTPAPEDTDTTLAAIENTANMQEQLIYISKAKNTTSVSVNNTWVADASGTQRTWTTKRPKYNSSYPVLFVATQRKTLGGTVTCTTPVIDDTTTVIDGGNIITGSVTAGAINAQSGTFDIANIPDLTAEKITAGQLKSANYMVSAAQGVPYSAAGTRLDLNTGNFYTPAFGIVNEEINSNYPVGLYLNNGFVAASGKIGWSSTNYWNVGTLPINGTTPTTGITAVGNALINVGELILESNKDSNNNASLHTGIINNNGSTYTRTYLRDPDNYWRDYGLQAPVLNSNAANYSTNVDDNFLYIKKSPSNSDTVPTSETDWNYLFRVDKDGNLHTSGSLYTTGNMYINGQEVQSGGNFVKVNGDSTITGKLAISQGLAGNLKFSDGTIYNGSGNETITISYSNVGAAASEHNHDSTYLKLSGGDITGPVGFQSSNSAIDLTDGINFKINNAVNGHIGLNNSGRLGIYSKDAVYIQPGAGTMSIDNHGISISTTALSPTANNIQTLGTSSLKWSNVYATTFTGNLSGNATTATSAGKATNDSDGNAINTTYLKRSGGTMTGKLIATDIDVSDELTVNGGFYANGSSQIDSASIGQLIVTGNARFDNGINGTASNAIKDNRDQQIDSTYIKGLSVSGKTITYTRGDGTTGTITTQDTNTTYSAGTGLTLSDTTFSVTSANVSTMINLLSEGTSPANREDYAIVQYAGGGTSITTYHRRKLSNVFGALNSSDITNALGFTPYNATNPNGYTTNKGTVTSITIGAGDGIAIDATGAITTSGTRTISHGDTSSQASIAANGRTYITGVTLDDYGHVTGLTTGTETVTNTHNTAYLYAGASNGTANAATTNGNTYLILMDGGAATTRRKIAGSGTVTVASNASGDITITGSAHPTALKNPNALELNVYSGTTTAATTTYDGSTAKSVNVAGNNAFTDVSASEIGSAGSTTFTFTTAAGGTKTLTVDVTGAVTTGAIKLTDTSGTAIDAGEVTKPVYFENGLPAEVTSIPYTLISGTSMTLNGSLNASPSWYAPTTAGTSTYVLTSSGSGAPSWTAQTALTSIFQTLSSSTNTLTVKVGGTQKTANLINSVSNTWTAGTTTGPTIKTTVNGIEGTAVAIPSATGSASGVVTTTTQTFAGVKTFSNTTASTSTTTGAVLISGGAGIAGRVTASEINATRTMVVSAGKVYSNISGSNVILPAKTSMLFANGLAIANPGLAAANDVGWIRVTGTSESDMVLEIATGDDAGAGEAITVRQYNTSNAIAKEIYLLNTDGNSVMRNILPGTNNTYSLGNTLHYWANAYITNVHIGTQDSYGSSTTPIYWNSGVPTASTATVGALYNPIYLNGGTLTPSNGYTIEYIVGTQTEATGTWTGITQDSELYIGKMIAYKLPKAGNGSATLTLTLADNSTTAAIPVYAGTVRLTTHYGAESVLIMTYDGTAWRTNPYYNTNTNTLLRVYSSATNLDVPLIGQSSANSTTAAWASYTGTYKDWYGAIPNDNSLRPKMNLLTGVLTVPGGIVGNASTATTASAAPWSGITSKPDTATRWPKWNEISQSGAESIEEGTSDFTDNTEIFSSYASNNGFADTTATKGKVYRRDAIHMYNYIKGKTDSIYVNITGDTMTGELKGTTFTASATVTGKDIAVSGSNTGGLSLYGGVNNVWAYGMAFATTAAAGKHGYVQGDWATYFTMAGATNRGWVFKHGGGGKTVNGNVASISGLGQFQGLSYNVAGHCNLEYDESAECLNFVFD